MSILCQVSGVKPLTDTILQVFLKPDQGTPIHYEAGQYVYLELSNQQSLPFSIANAPLCNTDLEFHIRHTRDNPYTEQLLKDIAAGLPLRLHGPEGNCTYRSRDPQRPCLFLAGGTGFAPIKAMIEQALADHIDQPIHLYWVARTPSELYCLELAEHWAKHVDQFYFTPIISTAHPTWSGRIGLLPEHLNQDFKDLSSIQVFAAGPNDLVLAAFQVCQQLGLPREHFLSDLFAFLPKP